MFSELCPHNSERVPFRLEQFQGCVRNGPKSVTHRVGVVQDDMPRINPHFLCNQLRGIRELRRVWPTPAGMEAILRVSGQQLNCERVLQPFLLRPGRYASRSRR